MSKVLFCIGQLFGGGAERVVSVWSRQLAEAGFDTHILIYGRGENEYVISDAVQMHSVVDRYEQYKHIPPFKRILALRKQLKAIRPDVLISFLPGMQISMMFANLWTGIRRIETIRISPWHAGIKNKMQGFLWRRCFATSDAVILQTEEQGEFFSASVRKKCCTIPNPLSAAYLHNKKKEYREPIRSFAAAGRLTDQKNYQMMFEAVKKASEKTGFSLSLDVYGLGSEQYVSLLQKKIDELNMQDRIHLKGRADHLEERLPEYDAFLMSSNFEGMPNALAEAMATGLVCISTDCRTGPKDMIRDGATGFLASTGSMESFSESICRAVQLSADQAGRIGRAAMEFILDYCGETNSKEKLAALIQKLCR